MKNKLVKTLLVSILAVTALSACNSGASNSATEIQSTPNAISATQSATISEDPLPTTLEMLTGGFEDVVMENVAGWILGKVTDGAFPPDSSTQLLNNIRKNLQTIENQLTVNNTLLVDLVNQINNNEYTQQQETINTVANSINTFYDGFSLWISTNLGDNSLATLGSFQGTSIEPISESALVYMSQNQKSIVNQLGPFAALDSAEQDLSCDNASPYSATNPSLHQNSVNLQSPCAIAAALSAEIAEFENNNPITKGQNALENVVTFNSAIELSYLNVVQAMTNAYAIDQLRVYLGENPNSRVTIPTVVLPADAALGYSNTLADVNYAYNQRLGYITQIYNDAKSQVFQYYTSAHDNIESINSLSMESQCGFNYQNIESSLTAGSGSYYWDGNTLTATCQNIKAGMITTTSNIADMCSNANLQVINGYISCGPSATNYIAAQGYNQNNFQAPQVPAYDTVTNYGDASFNQLYSFGVSGTLDVYFDQNFPLIYTDAIRYMANGMDGEGISNLSATGFNVYSQPGSGNTAATIMALVDDGVHAYMIGAGEIDNKLSDDQAYMILECVPGDKNCQEGNFPNPNSPTQGQEAYNALVFSNGDVVSMYNQFTGNYHGNYYIHNYYNNTAPSYLLPSSY